MLPGDATLLNRAGITSPGLASWVHVTPLRASRALALRFLSHKFGVGLDAFTLMVVPLAAADLRDADERNGQSRLFGIANECEGMCGV